MGCFLFVESAPSSDNSVDFEPQYIYIKTLYILESKAQVLSRNAEGSLLSLRFTRPTHKFSIFGISLSYRSRIVLLDPNDADFQLPTNEVSQGKKLHN